MPIFILGQEDEPNSDYKDFRKERFMVIDLGYNLSFPSDQQLYTSNLDNGSGFSFSGQYYFHENYYAGLGIGLTAYDLRDKNLLGSYDRTVKFDAVLFTGLDYEVVPNLHVGVEAGLGLASFHNVQNSEQGDRAFTDGGSYFFIAAPIDLPIIKHLHFLIRPQYEFINLLINTPREIEDDFSRARFLNFHLGLRYVIY